MVSEYRTPSSGHRQTTFAFGCSLAQYEATIHVDPAHKQVGDLIFFGSPGSIYHEGIYAGDGKMWAAPHSGDVVKLESIYSTTYYVGRVL